MRYSCRCIASAMMHPIVAAKFVVWLLHRWTAAHDTMVSSCNIVPLLLPCRATGGHGLGEGRPSSRLEVDGVPWETVDAWFAEADWDGDGRIAGDGGQGLLQPHGAASRGLLEGERLPQLLQPC